MADKGAAQQVTPKKNDETAQQPLSLAAAERAFSQNPDKGLGDYGLALCRAGQAKEALALLGKAHQKSPLMGTARVALARALFDTFKIDEADLLMRETMQAWKEDAQAQRLLGEIALERDKKDIAIEHVRKSFDLNSGDPATRELMIFLGLLSADERVDVSEQLPDDEAEAVVAAQRNLRGLNETLKRAGITAAVMVLVLGIYAWRTRTNEKINHFVTAAKLERQKSDLKALNQADALYKQAIELDSSNPAALGGLAEVHALLLNEYGVEASKAELTQWSERASKKDVPTGERYLGEAMRMIAAGEAGKAQDMLAKTLEKGGVDARVFYALGFAEKTLGKAVPAREALRRAHDLDPFQPTFAAELGDLFIIDNDLRNADHYWRKAVEANPDHTRGAARALLGRVLMGGDPAQVKKDLAALAEKEATPVGKAAIAAAQAELALAQGNNAEAARLAKDAITAKPGDPALDWVYGHVLTSVGNKDGLAAYDRLLKRFSGLNRLQNESAFAAARFGKPEDGEARVKANREFYDSPKGQALVADLYLRAGDTGKAFPFVQRALKAEPGLPEGLYAMGRVHQLKRELPKALEQYGKALDAKQQYPEVYHQVANIYVENKEYEQARANYGQAEKQYLAASAPFATLARLYEDVARSYDKQGGKDAKANADKWRNKAKRKG